MKKQYKNIKYALKSFNAKEVIRKTNKDMLATLIYRLEKWIMTNMFFKELISYFILVILTTLNPLLNLLGLHNELMDLTEDYETEMMLCEMFGNKFIELNEEMNDVEEN